MSLVTSRSLLLLAALCLPLHTTLADEKPFVTVNGVSVSRTLAEIYMLHGKAQKLDPKKLEQDVREEIIRRELMYQEAKRLGIDKQSEVAQKAEAEKAKAARAVREHEGSKPGHDGKGAGQGVGHSGGHAGNGH